MNAKSRGSDDTISLASVVAFTDVIHGRFVDELVEFRRRSRSERINVASSAIEKLEDLELINARESDLLRTVQAHVGNVDATDLEIARTVRALFDEESPKGLSPVVEVVLRIAVDSTSKEAQRAIEEGRADETGDGPVAHADVEAALVGAILGAELAAPKALVTAGFSVGLGAGLGGLIGGAAGSIAEAI